MPTDTAIRTEDLIAAIAAGTASAVKAALGKVGKKHDATGTGSTAGFMHGPGGLFTYPGVEPEVISTIIGHVPGLANSIPTRPSIYASPIHEMVTGLSEPGGTEERAACDDALVGGVLSACKFYFPFGRLERQTREVEINKLGLLNNRAEPMDLRIIGGANLSDPFSGPQNFLPANMLRSEVDRLFFERGVSFARKLNQWAWTGNPSNNAGTGYKEPIGVELMTSASGGWKDVETNTACAASAPDIKAFGYKRLDGSAANSNEMINSLTYMYRYVREIAMRSGLDPVRWAFFMRPTLWYELTHIWPCAYLSYVCQTTNSAYTYNIDLAAQAAMRDSMRQGMYLLIDGIQVPVVIDDAIPEKSNTTSASVTSGCFASDIYLLPLSYQGGTAALYWEYFDYTNPSLAAAANDGLALYRVAGNGAFLETARQKNWCITWQAKVEPRLVLKTPHLVGRLTNVQYCPLQVPPQPFPSDPYYRAGGQTSRTPDTLYAPV